VTELERLFRAEWGRILAALIHAVGDFDLAEDALQEAFSSAVAEWEKSPPRNPRAWLYSTARHKAIDVIRRRARFAGKQTELAAEMEMGSAAEMKENFSVPDERLRLIFTCCHPALAPEAQVAVTLRTLCGLTTEEIARSFLVPTATMSQRLVRAKAKIRDARIPYRVPTEGELQERLSAVMAVVYLVFNEGYSAAQGDALIRHELSGEAIRLARLLRALLPAREPELDALLALMLLHDSRCAARVNDAGEILLLAQQDRTRWNQGQIEEGRELIQAALQTGPIGPYAIEAAIAAVHAKAARAEETDWPQIAALYERLLRLHPSPVVALNRAVAAMMAQGAEAALPLVDALAGQLENYHLFHATRADFLRRLGRNEEAIISYRRALELAQNEIEKRFLTRRIEEVA
jgi:RNA polymerase sigma-70 factor, ECF subfamily